ncbi:MAG: hypothetical protein KDM91_05015 [Verrucomicrobiae bacterium]|nr:hypothetical protein [Verrucomicrobiae bacterium]MCP5551932.1 hypothetical protein [Akkermansiaceae bacterium]
MEGAKWGKAVAMGRLRNGGGKIKRATGHGTGRRAKIFVKKIRKKHCQIREDFLPSGHVLRLREPTVPDTPKNSLTDNEK